MAGTWWPALRAGELIAYLTEDELERLNNVTVPVSAEPGDVIFYKGAPSKSLVIVEEGEVEAFERTGDRVLVLGSAGAGSVMGELGFLDGRPRSNHVRASTACRLRKLTREQLLHLAGEDALLFAKLVISLAELLASRYRGVVAELEPVRALVASVRAGASEPAAGDPEFSPPEQSQAMDVLKAVALQTNLAEL
jgi:CRP/FNR family transcriptional regulator, cyclic AMP receptor protein